MYIEKHQNAAGSKIAVTNTATTLFDLINTAASTTLVNAGFSSRVNAINLTVEDGDIRVFFDGNTPTATDGILLSSGNVYYYRGVPLDKMKLIRVGGSNVACSVEVGHSDASESTSASAYNVTLEAGGSPLPVTFSTTVVQAKATGAAAINLTTAVAAEFRLVQVTCHFSTAPTTSENFVVKLDAQGGAVYDTTLFTTNPSLSSETDIAFIPDSNLDFFAGDEIVVTFTNTDARVYGVTIYYELI